MIVALPENLRKPLAAFPESRDRADSAMYFAYRASCSDKALYADSETAIRRREAYFRAALAEFVSIEEALTRDLARKGVSQKAVKIRESTNPLLHLMRLFRHLWIHLTSPRLNSRQVEAAWSGAQPEDFDITVWLVSDLSIKALDGLRDAKRYSQDQLEKMVTWFNQAQEKWGASYLLEIAITEYVRLICQQYGLSCDSAD